MKEDFFNKLFVHPQYGICMYINVASNKQWHNCFEHTKKSLQTLKSKVCGTSIFLYNKTIHQTSFFLFGGSVLSAI